MHCPKRQAGRPALPLRPMKALTYAPGRVHRLLDGPRLFGNFSLNACIELLIEAWHADKQGRADFGETLDDVARRLHKIALGATHDGAQINDALEQIG